ncbi:IS630 family transposase [Natrialba sp. INN-245]|nr:IS630 family transposase [Natrialba sp. INN-245]
MKDAGYRIVVIDQHSEAVATVKRPGWYPVNSRPRVSVFGGRKRVNLLGAVTDDGDRFVCLTPDRFTAEVSKYFLRALQYEFGEKLVVILDNAPYFMKQAAADGLLLEYLPAHSPELNPLEPCWEQLRQGRANRLFLTVRDVEQYLKTALKNLNPPELYEFLC